MKVVLFLLDAFRYDYVSKETTPFLWDCSRKGKYIKQIIPSGGFCERAEIFTGLKPNASGFFTAIGFDPNKSPYKSSWVLILLGMCETLISNLEINERRLSDVFRRIALRIFRNYFSKIRLKPYNIPFSFLKYFNLTEDEFDITANTNTDSISIFKVVEMKGKSSFYGAFTSLGMPSNGTDTDRINLALAAALDKDYMFIPIYIGVIDAEGHRYGPDSKELKIELSKLDFTLKTSVDKFLEIDETINFVFLGDHGMTKVNSCLDVQSILLNEAKLQKLTKGKDFIYFLDSTLLRVWFLTEKAKLKLEPAIQKNNMLLANGEAINDHISDEFDLPINDRRYGDISWWANEGVLVFPDFFHYKKPYKGMHGYKPIHLSTNGTCIVFGKSIASSYSDSMKLNQAFQIIKELL